MLCKRMTKLIERIEEECRQLPDYFDGRKLHELLPRIAYLKKRLYMEIEAISARYNLILAKPKFMSTLNSTERIKLRKLSWASSNWVSENGKVVAELSGRKTTIILRNIDSVEGVNLPLLDIINTHHIFSADHPLRGAEILADTLQVSPDGQSILVWLDNGLGTKRLCAFLPDQEKGIIKTFFVPAVAPDKITCAFSADSEKIICLEGKSLSIIQTTNTDWIKRRSVHLPVLYEKPRSIRLVNEGKGLLVEDGYCQYVDLSTKKITHLANCDDSIYDEASGRYLTRSNKAISLQNLKNDDLDEDLGQLGYISAEEGPMAISPNGRLLAYSSDDHVGHHNEENICVVEYLMEDLPALRKFRIPSSSLGSQIQQISFAGNDRLVVLMTDGRVYLIEREQNSEGKAKNV